MTRTSRYLTLLALLLALPLAVACGGGEPADNGEPQEAGEEMQDEATPADPVEEPSEADSEATTQEPPEGEEDGDEDETGSQEPDLVGDINIANADFEWGETTPDEASYTWSARVTNDTTATLDITVLFSFYDANDDALKTESATVRLAPAESQTVSGEGTMIWDEANEIYSTAATYEYDIVE
ncbi:MAG: hypothetical protein ACOC5E_00410 [Acidobacteriota bacterium]